MKQFLLSAMLLAAGATAANAQSFELYIGNECETTVGADGKPVENINYKLISEGEVFTAGNELNTDYGYYESIAYLLIKNKTDLPLNATMDVKVSKQEIGPEANEWFGGYMWCFFGSCSVPLADASKSASIPANSETFGGSGEHIAYTFAYDNEADVKNYAYDIQQDCTVTANGETLHFSIVYRKSAGSTDIGSIEAANAEIAKLETALTNALAEIATAAPDVKGYFQGEEIRVQINALKESVNKAYEDKTIVEKYDEIMAPVLTINAAITKLVEDAKAAQAEFDAEKARQKAYTDANAEIAKLETALTNALAVIAKDASDVKGDFQGEEIRVQINTLKESVNKAYEDKTIVEKYDEILAPMATINAEIAKLIDDAKAAQTEFEAEEARKEALANANAEIAALETALANALSEIAKDAPDVKGYFQGEEIRTQINALKESVNKAYEDKTIVEKYDEIMVPVATINAAIAKLIEDAKAAQAEFDAEKARQKAYADANAEIAKLETALANALTEIATVAPDVKNDFKGEEIRTQINTLKESVNKAYEDKTIVEKYDEIMVPVATINAAIAKLIEDAKAAQAEFDAEKARQKAYADANAEIAKLETALANALAEIATAAPNVKDDFKGEEIRTQINALKESVNKAYEDKTIVEKYDEIMAPMATINAAITKLIEDAKAAQAEFDAEKARQKAYADANAEIAKLEAALTNALAEIATAAPNVKSDFKGEEIRTQINALKESVNKAYEDKTIVEKYDEILVSVATIDAAITKLVEDAKAAQAEYEEQLRKAANQAAYEADREIIEDLQQELDIVVDMIELVYPDYDVTTASKTVQDAIDAEADKAAAALAAVENEGIYENTVDAAAIRAMIEKLKEDAKTTGINMIHGEPIGDNARIFTLEGVEVPTLQKGKVNIIVYSDGRKEKVFIK